jgi:HD-GYP domain-containing protein (c-di-GMP phosphodiesterase class II)
MTKGTPTNEDRWEARRAAATWLRAGIFLVPFVAGFGVGLSVASVLPEPLTARDIAVWWALVVLASTVAATLTDRLARRLLPMTVLLKMTMLFPDRAPSRMRVALRSGNIKQLRDRVAAARLAGDSGTGEMAEAIISLATALSHHDRRTRGHSERTRAYTDILAEEMGLEDEARDKLRWAALLHDVGKLEIPAETLNKVGKLSDEEWHQLRQHPVMGMKLVGPLLPWLGAWAETIEHHHERWDGTGYPHGVSGTDIALGARIVSVADAYDVMTSGRSYQKAKTPAAARAEIAAMAGSQFDPAVVRALMNVSLGKLRWSTGPLAMLAELPLIRGLPDIGRDTATLLTSSAVLATSIATGMVTTPVEFTVSDAAEVMEIVLSGGDLSSIGLPFTGDEDEETDEEARGEPSTTTSSSSSTSSTTSTTAVGAGEDEASPTPAPTDPDPTTTTTVPGNQAPRAESDAATTDEDTAVTIDVLANDSDPDGRIRPSSLHLVSTGSLGTATASSGSVTYVPAKDRSGSDELAYRICDGEGGCDEANVTVSVRPVNDPPAASPATASVPEDQALKLPLRVSDPEGDAVSCKLAATPRTGAATVPADCSRLVYQPASDMNGDVTIAIEVTDGAAVSQLDVRVAVTPVNDAPVVTDDSASTNWNQPVDVAVLANDSDVDGEPLTVRLVSSPPAGSAAVTGGGAIRYSPAAGSSGTHSIGYEACDRAGACARATLAVDVSGFTAALADAAGTRRNVGVEVDVRSNDVPGIGEWADPAITVIEQPDWGGTQVRGNRRIMYWPTRNWTGTDTFTYRICDAAGSCATSTVTVDVTRR